MGILYTNTYLTPGCLHSIKDIRINIHTHRE